MVDPFDPFDPLDPANNFIVSVCLTWPQTNKMQRSNVCGHLLFSFNDNEDEIASYVNFGTVAVSRDGESRSVAVPRKYFNAILEHPFWEDIEDLFIKYVQDAKLDSIFYFPPTIQQNSRRKFKQWFFAARYDFKIALANFYLVIESMNLPRTDLQTPSYLWVKDDYEALSRIVRSVEAKYMVLILQNLVITIVHSSLLAMKITPLTLNELACINDIRYRPWKETYVQRIVHKLSFARICSQFIGYWNWAMIYDIDENMFMNPLMLNKFRQSDALDDIRKILKTSSEIASSHDKESKTPDIFQDEMQQLEQYSVMNVRLSTCAIVNINVVLSRKLNWTSQYGFDEMSDIIFGWMYGLLVLHHHVGVLHTDPHMSNLFQRRTTVKHDFIIDGKSYQMKTTFHGIIIDFSRVIINPYFQPITQYTTVNQDTLSQEEGQYLLRFYLGIFPNSEYAELIQDLIKNDFDRAFHILSILDPIFALHAIKADLQRYVNVPESIHRFIDILSAKCENWLAMALKDPQKIDISSYPLQSIIIDHFDMKPIAEHGPYTYNFNGPFEHPSIHLSDSARINLQKNLIKQKLNDI